MKGNRVEAIKEIAEIAFNAGQSNLVDICNKFLSQYKRKKEDQERKGAQRKQGKESRSWWIEKGNEETTVAVEHEKDSSTRRWNENILRQKNEQYAAY